MIPVRFGIVALLLSESVPTFAQIPELPADTKVQEPTPLRTEVEKPQPKKRKIPLLGLDLGVYLPVSSRTKDAFGDAWYSFGLGFGGVTRPKQAGRFQFDAQLISNTRSRNRAYITPIGVNYQIAFAKESQPILPYVTASVDFVGTYLAVPDDNIKYGFRPSYGGSLAIGATYKNQAFLEVRYHEFAKVRGFDLSGLEIGTGFRF